MKEQYLHSRYEGTVDIHLVKVLDEVTYDKVQMSMTKNQQKRCAAEYLPRDAKVSSAASSLNINHRSSLGLSKVSQR
jgi:hypothetical protein